MILPFLGGLCWDWLQHSKGGDASFDLCLDVTLPLSLPLSFALRLTHCSHTVRSLACLGITPTEGFWG